MPTVILEPDGQTLSMAKANTVLQLLNRLGLKPARVLVIRDGTLLTPDLPLRHDDIVTIRKVGSRG